MGPPRIAVIGCLAGGLLLGVLAVRASAMRSHVADDGDRERPDVPSPFVHGRLRLPPGIGLLAASDGGAEMAEPPERPDVKSDPEALGRANALVDAALTRGSWGLAEARALRPLVSRLSASDRYATVGRFIAAMNAGKLRIETGWESPL
jgi:hypothetical protein